MRGSVRVTSCGGEGGEPHRRYGKVALFSPVERALFCTSCERRAGSAGNPKLTKKLRRSGLSLRVPIRLAIFIDGAYWQIGVGFQPLAQHHPDEIRSADFYLGGDRVQGVLGGRFQRHASDVPEHQGSAAQDALRARYPRCAQRRCLARLQQIGLSYRSLAAWRKMFVRPTQSLDTAPYKAEKGTATELTNPPSARRGGGHPSTRPGGGLGVRLVRVDDRLLAFSCRATTGSSQRH